ncbi:probable inactive histone-lysine N-methyltransferase SUVR2 isoform X1 [Morus notabilis]|uniref:probable inactive histone-lysine N-methyltransferase SUVR2 isoform X1 n=1 Tax=Morus notabilis TaxID=981085 RepID=UPI000CED3E18|nr:probable inactive histone-lysine N-methyltransferase SUVR2 isoform X1 [Morus notabilis]XP_024018394.1 probable inactive histone-lysine N-methyltransferase SUVR2 isoform X1 [Morus notabilis]XP_024018395.1 probable inactive histone-lysine N-methyltransferase SUVR2 isoform X1 [Morus notabilis]XP_024018397.1 probable inactive histone-lysine N-methyltransferase SUVR2 isoform X1 [Morus notabilis]
MAPNPRVQAAFRAMKSLGVKETKVKRVLKKLLRLYDKNWALIEEESYRALADAIFEEDDSVDQEKNKGNDVNQEDNLEGEELGQEPERPLKRLPLKRLRRGAEVHQQPENITESPEPRDESCSISQEHGAKNKGKQPIISEPPVPQQRLSPLAPAGKRVISERASHGVCLREPTETGSDLFPKQTVPNHQLIKPKDEPFIDDMIMGDIRQYEVPIAVIHPDLSSEKDMPMENDENSKEIGKESSFQCKDGGTRADGIPSPCGEMETNVSTMREESPSNLDVATSPLGEDNHVQASEMTLANGCGGKDIDGEQTHVNGCAVKHKDRELEDHGLTNVTDLAVVPLCELAHDDLRSRHDINDIAKGEEGVRIPWINEINSERPPSFHYISQSLVFHKAEISITLSRIGDLSCCPTCFGDCVSASIPCACAQAIGSEFAYTSTGQLTDVFLDSCISMTRDPQKQCQVFCGECPLEKSKNDVCLEACKGHLKRNFIKECWSKCGCNKSCGNRVVQRGITRKLQVFFTSDGKGWGLRTLEDLPKGSFVCQYVGEILTSAELYERNLQCDKSRKDTYIALLDADWGSKTALKNEKAVCLDASRYGNVARFINHRCLDANLVEIPVEVETPDRHYYHLAFFATRKIDAMEELTWDYGIDFDDHDNPIKPFQCRCGSKFCRNMKRRSK